MTQARSNPIQKSSLSNGSILFGEQHGDFIIAIVSHHTNAQFENAEQTLNTFLQENCNLTTELDSFEYDKQLVYRFQKDAL